eukprot:PITA_04161
MGSKAKEEAMNSLIRLEAPDILLIQETKLEDLAFLQASRKFWKKDGAHATSARGASGGLGSLWNPNKFSLISESLNTHWILLKLQHLESKETISLVNVYAPNNAGEKRICWDSIKNLVDLENLENIIIVGDLNLTLLSSEKRGGSIFRDPARESVEDLMQHWDLIDIKPTAGKYTWTNKSIISDHKPISFELLPPKDLGPIPFRFSSLWIKEVDFMDKVRDCWKDPVKGSAFSVWEEKLKRVKAMLKNWAKTLPNPAAERKKSQIELENQHLHLQIVEITKEELEKEAKLQQNFHKACLAEEEYWRLKSRSLWLKYGDRNSYLFHKQDQSRKGRNSIIEIKEENNVLKDFASIKKAASDHFEKLYKEESGAEQNDSLLDAIPNLITPKMNQVLKSKIMHKEAKEALFAMDPDKAPGPDGFTPRILQTCWQIIKKEFLKMIQNSQDLIANRLKRFLPKIILNYQGGFIQGRQLVDNFVLVQEAIHSSQHRKEKGMVIKLDLANSFYRVRHRFLFDVMYKLGFGQNLIKWIKACISEPWIAPLVNGRAAEFLKASRGLRQGCPLSPLLFVIQAFVLSFYLNKKQQEQDIVGLCIARGVKCINHALFADDTLLLGAATPHSAIKFKSILDNFCKTSGSVLNKGKCQIYCWNIPASTANSIARCLGFAASTTWSSFKYLGLPIFNKRASSKYWAPQLDKFKAKMQS